MWLAPGQTNNAVVTCYIPPNIEVGTKDKITFSSQGQNLASQSAILTVTSAQSPIQVSKINSIHLFEIILFFFFTRLGSLCAINLLEVWKSMLWA